MFKKKKTSLQLKMVRTVSISMILLGLTMLIVGLGMYGYTLINQYIGESYSVSKSCAAMIQRMVKTEDMAKEVLRIYRDMPQEERQKTGSKEYRQKFTHLTYSGQYQRLREILKEFGESSIDITDVYMAYYDKETGALVYICDPGENITTRFFTGEWETVPQREIDKFRNWDGKGRLYDISIMEAYGWMCTSGIPLRMEGGEIYAYVLSDVTLNEVFLGMRIFALQYTVALLLIVGIISLLLNHHIRKSLVEPINKIARAAQEYVEDHSQGINNTKHFASLDIHTGDEVENLGRVMDEMEHGLADYEENLKQIISEKERAGVEMTLAASIQADMLPDTSSAFPDRHEFKIYATMDPARQIGGDFYDFYLIDEDHLGLTVADVSGKGVPAALLMMASKIILANSAKMGQTPGKILENINRALCSHNTAGMFVTVWMGILEISTGIVTAANAGHEYPAVKHHDRFELLKDKHGLVVGGMEDMHYREYQIRLEPGAKLFLYTDGVPETTDSNERMFGTERMINVLNEDPDVSVEDLLERLRKETGRFADGAPQFDDITMLCLEYRGQ